MCLFVLMCDVVVMMSIVRVITTTVNRCSFVCSDVQQQQVNKCMHFFPESWVVVVVVLR